MSFAPEGETIALLRDEVVVAQEKHPELELAADPAEGLVVRGRVGFRTPWSGKVVENDYLIELRSFENYPSLPPRAFETGGKIGKDFGHFMADGSLCLGTPVEVRYRFARSPNLYTFLDKLVVPYLFSHSYKLTYGKVPYGERSHSNLGLIEFYSEFFHVNDYVALKLLKLLADNFAPPASRCPCDSGKRLKDCHGPKLDELRPYYKPTDFASDIIDIIKDGVRAGRRFPGEKVLPDLMRKRIKKARRQNRRGSKRQKIAK